MTTIESKIRALIEFDPDGKELTKAGDSFEKEFAPGTPFGVPDSFYMSWLYFDLRFGRTEQTVCERFTELLIMRKLHEPGPTLLRHMRDSYSAFYQVASLDTDWILLDEFGTGTRWRAHRESSPVPRDRGDKPSSRAREAACRHRAAAA